LASEVTGEAKKLINAFAAAESGEALPTPAEKVVTIWTAGGNIAMTLIPLMCISSERC
jgi:hypothetical protein